MSGSTRGIDGNAYSGRRGSYPAYRLPGTSHYGYHNHARDHGYKPGHSGGHHVHRHYSYPWLFFGGLGTYPYYGYYGSGFGYGAYPYYGSYGYYGYSQPQSVYVTRVDPDIAAPNAVADSGAVNEFEQLAIEAFRDGQYEEAARLANHAIVDAPQEVRPYLLAAQALFAVAEYQASAGVLHQAATLVEPSALGEVVRNYKSYYRGRDYVDQMERLIAHLRENPDDAAAHFVRGFQYGFLGYHDPAVKDLTRTVELEARDQLAAQLIKEFGGRPPVQNADAPAPDAAAPNAAPPEATERPDLSRPADATPADAAPFEAAPSDPPPAETAPTP